MPGKMALVAGKLLEHDVEGNLLLGDDPYVAPLALRLIAIPDAATYTLLAKNTGKTHVLPDLGQDIVISMPIEQVGLEYTFIYGGIAADVSDWQFDTGANANFYLGGLAHLDTGAGSAGDEVVPIAGDGNSNSKLDILVPDVGTRVHMICDGTNWFLSGVVVGETVPNFADQ